MPLGKFKNGDAWPSSRSQVKRNKTNRYPLRRVIDDGVGLDPSRPNSDVDALDCGHFMIGATDMIGRRYPARRRCWKCAAKEESE